MLYYKGDFVWGGLCPRCKIQREDFVNVVKYSEGGGGLCLSYKVHRGDYVLVYKK